MEEFGETIDLGYLEAQEQIGITFFLLCEEEGVRGDQSREPQQSGHRPLRNREVDLRLCWASELGVSEDCVPLQLESGLAGASVSCGCRNKLPQAWWLQTTHIYSLRAPEGRIGSHSLWLSREDRAGSRWRVHGEPSPCLFQLLGAACISWLMTPNPCCPHGIYFFLVFLAALRKNLVITPQ